MWIKRKKNSEKFVNKESDSEQKEKKLKKLRKNLS